MLETDAIIISILKSQSFKFRDTRETGAGIFKEWIKSHIASSGRNSISLIYFVELSREIFSDWETTFM